MLHFPILYGSITKDLFISESINQPPMFFKRVNKWWKGGMQKTRAAVPAAWGPLMILISALMLLLGWWKSARAENERTDRWQLSRFLGLGLTPYWSTTDEAATSTKLWHTCLTSLSTKSDSDNDLLLAKKNQGRDHRGIHPTDGRGGLGLMRIYRLAKTWTIDHFAPISCHTTESPVEFLRSP